MKGRNLSAIPENMRFTPEWAGDCWHCSQLHFRGEEYCINTLPWKVPKALSDLCPPRSIVIRADAGLSEDDELQKAAENEGWLPWKDLRVNDGARLNAFKDVCWRILEPLTLAA